MSWTYSCPKCHAMLNPHDTIILLGAPGPGKRVLIGFHPQPGNYQIYLPPEISVAKGEEWEFFCPVCRSNLVALGNDQMCRIDLVDGESRQEVFFSRVAGEKMTFVHGQEGIEIFESARKEPAP